MRSSPGHSNGLYAVAAGLLYVVQALIGLAWPQPAVFATLSDYVLESVFIAALLFTLPSLLSLRHHLSARASWPGTAGFYAASAGAILMLASASATLMIGRDALGLLFVAGLLGAITGNLLLGAAMLRTNTLPRWCGPLFLLGLPISISLASFGGGVVLGGAWIAVGYAIGRERGSQTNRDNIGTAAS